MAKRATTYSLFLRVKGGLQLGVEFQNLKAKKYNPRTHCSKKCLSNYIFKGSFNRHAFQGEPQQQGIYR